MDLRGSAASTQARVTDEVGLRLARDRYRALGRLRAAQDGDPDWYAARMLGRPALVVRGEEGVRAFYDPALVTRRGAVPAPLRLLLFGPGAVHGLDGDAHARRKRLHLGAVRPDTVARLTAEVAGRLDRAVARWVAQGRPVVLFDELVRVYGAAALAWAGIETDGPDGLDGPETRRTGHELALVVDGFGLGGTPYPRAALARLRTQRWALDVVREVRAGRRTAPAGSPLAAVADADLSDLVAATELLNLVRPTVAVAYFGAYAAHALDRRPDWRDRLAAGAPEDLRAFEHEIRRWYPFAPLLTGRLRREHRWRDRTFRRGDWMVLDVLGTNRDPRLWERPDAFEPERFLGREPTAWDYVPHGGGDPAAGHRCPGEPLAVGVLGATLQRLAGLPHVLAPESREVPMDRIPSLPRDRVRLLDVRSG